MLQQNVVLDGTNQIVLAGKGAVDLNLPSTVTTTVKAKGVASASTGSLSASKGLTAFGITSISSKIIATGLAVTAVPGATAAIVAATAIGIFSARRRDTKIFGFRITRD